MANILLTWHGAIVCWSKGILAPASPAAVATRVASPLLIDTDGTLLNGPAGVAIDPAPSGHFTSAYVLRAGDLHLTCRNEPDFHLVTHALEWEFFMPVPQESAALIAEFCSTSWQSEEGHRLQGRCAEFGLWLGDRRFDVESLSLSEDRQNLILPDGRAIKSFRPPDLSLVAMAVETVLKNPENTRRVAVWAEGSQLAPQLFLVITAPHHAPHLFHLARLCAFLEHYDAALACLDALDGMMGKAEILWARATIAYRQKDDSLCRELLREAIQCASEHAPRREMARNICAHFLGENCHPLVFARAMADMCNIHFDGEFHKVLVPSPLSQDADFETRRVYLRGVEEFWGLCQSTRRTHFLDAERAFNGESHALRLVQGHEAWYRGAVSEANDHYENARHLSMRSGLDFVHFNCGAYSWLTDSPRPPEPLPLDLNGWEWHWQESDLKQSEPDLCVIAGSDSHYFRFVPRLVASLIQACENGARPGMIHLVLGFASPSREQIAFLKRVAAGLRAARSPVALSFAHGRLAHNDGASFACIRYLMMPDIVSRYSCPVMTTDIDAMFPQAFLDLSEELRAQHDYGFRLYAFDGEGRQHMGEPWGFGAGVSYFGETDLLPLIARDLHDYIRTSYLTANPTNWCIDQCALAAIFHRHIGPRWASLRIRFMDHPPAIIVMPHHTGMDKGSFASWDGIVTMEPVYEALGLDPDEARALVS